MNFLRLCCLVGLFLSEPAMAQACGTADETLCEIPSGTFHVQLPDTDTPRGAVVMLHGGGGRGSGLLNTNISRLARDRGFVFVAPNGEHPGARFPNNWAVRATNDSYEKDDIVFLNAIMDDVALRFDVDRGNILLAGFSRGGSMVWDVACYAPQTARAYAPAAGAFWDELPETCEAPVDLFHTHGWNDRTVPLEGRPLRNGTLFQGDVWESLRILRAVNGCTNRQPSRSTIDGDKWWRHWEECTYARIDLMVHPGGHGFPSGWAEATLDWFDARLAE